LIFNHLCRQHPFDKNAAWAVHCNDLLAGIGGLQRALHLQDYVYANLAKQTVSNLKTPMWQRGMVPWLLAIPASLLSNFVSETNLT